MVWQFTYYSLPASVAAAISFLLIAVAWRHRGTSVGIPFVVFMAGVGVWSLASAIQLGFAEASTHQLFDKFSFVGAAIVPTAWLVLTARYSGYDDWLSRRVLALLAIEPAVTLVLVWTNGSHQLIWEGGSIDPSTVVPVAQYTYGTWYWINLGYSYLLVVAGLALLASVFRRMSLIYRKQAGTLIAAALIPLTANVAFTIGASPIPGVDLTTFSFAVTGVFFALALFRFDLLDRTPMARRRMIDELGDGFLVLDDDGRIVEANTNARGILDATGLVGRAATEVLPGDDLADADGDVIRTSGRSRQFYEVRCEPLEDYREELAGHLVALRDVTDRREYEQRLTVANRLLRHNLRNETNVILAHADALEASLDGEAVDRAGTIGDSARRIADLSRKAGRMEETLRIADGTPAVVDVTSIAKRAVERFRDSNVSITFDGSGEIPASVVDADLLDTAIGNLIENAIEHHDGTPQVRVAVGAGDPVRIHIADDGPGIPAMEHEVLSEGRETALKHGSGVGLWLVHWVVSASGGELAFEENVPAGTVVTIELPSA